MNLLATICITGLLARISGLLGARAEEIATLVTDEMGCPITLSRSMQAAGHSCRGSRSVSSRR